MQLQRWQRGGPHAARMAAAAGCSSRVGATSLLRLHLAGGCLLLLILPRRLLLGHGPAPLLLFLVVLALSAARCRCLGRQCGGHLLGTQRRLARQQF